MAPFHKDIILYFGTNPNHNMMQQQLQAQYQTFLLFYLGQKMEQLATIFFIKKILRL